MRWVGGPKISIFVHVQAVQGKKVQVEVGRWVEKGQNHVHVVIE